jgi:hypothetical protein
MNVSETQTLREVLTRRRRLVAQDVYVLGANLADTIQNVRKVEAAMSGCQPAPGAITRVIVRIDDPWAAQTWRRDHIGHAPWLADAVSLYEETARYVADRMRLAAGQHLVMVGRSPLSLAVLAELAQRRRERRMLASASPQKSDAEDRETPKIVLMGAEADELLADHRSLERRFGNDNELPHVEIASTASTAEAITRICDERPGSVVALLAPPDNTVNSEATHLASLRPMLPVLAWWSTTAGLPEEPLIGRLYPFGLSLVGRGDTPPMDNWTRLARLLHEQYRLADSTAGDDRPSRRPWDSGLPRFYQASNVRQVGCLISEAKLLGRSWSAATADELSQGDTWSDAEVEHLAAAEHASWVSFYRANGWTMSPKRDDRKRRHDLLTDWSSLPEAVRESNRKSVRRGLAMLAILGYRSSRPVWGHYRRVGQVTAERLRLTRKWRSETGSTLVARPGDWMITGPDGRRWSVDEEIFHDTYRALGGARFERTGTVRARRASPGELVNTIEGEALAGEDDWIVEGKAGERWVVPGPHFIEAYQQQGP